jgi:hypothetical protein
MRVVVSSCIVWLCLSAAWPSAHAAICPDPAAGESAAFLHTRASGDFGITSRSTIEWWMHLHDAPGENEVWPTVTKPRSYFVGLAGPIPALGVQDAEADEMSLLLSYQRPAGDGVTNLHLMIPGLNPPRRAGMPLHRWVHVAIQHASAHDWMRTVHIDGLRRSEQPDSGPHRQTCGPLYVLGVPGDELTTLTIVGGRVAPMNGCVDVIRVSDDLRYVTDEIVPDRRVRDDRDTYARWEFEGATPEFYRDTSGNGRHLFPGGTLDVAPAQSATTTWSDMKRGWRQSSEHAASHAASLAAPSAR